MSARAIYGEYLLSSFGLNLTHIRKSLLIYTISLFITPFCAQRQLTFIEFSIIVLFSGLFSEIAAHFQIFQSFLYTMMHVS